MLKRKDISIKIFGSDTDSQDDIKQIGSFVIVFFFYEFGIETSLDSRVSGCFVEVFLEFRRSKKVMVSQWVE